MKIKTIRFRSTRQSCILRFLLPAAVCAIVQTSAAVTHYVNLSNSTPAAPFLDWASAATNIQDAVDAAQPGDTVLATNGIYSTGGRSVYGLMTNRVVLDKDVTVQSVNGPGVTIIQGSQVPGTTNGDGAIRCVYLTNGAVLSGFTLTNGATRAYGDSVQEQSGGGVWCVSTNARVLNCVLAGDRARSGGGGAYSGTLSNCTLTGNSAYLDGGGASLSTLIQCALTTNSAGGGGGASQGTLVDCTISGNSTWGGGGGGVRAGTLSNCTLTGNSSAGDGGGAYMGKLNNCTLLGNLASNSGGGAYSAALTNCALTGNSAGGAGGVFGGVAYDCTITGNSATGTSRDGGGALNATLNNCILYYNRGRNASNYLNCTLNYCCTVPAPSGGNGNITNEPLLASASRLSANSACRGSGSPAYARGLDIDGELWLTPPSIGCDEFHAGSVTGAVAVAVSASWTEVPVGFAVDLTGLISGRTTASAWDFGDGIVLSNRPYASHAWSTPGDYSVILRAYNETFPDGLSATTTVHVGTSMHYVAADSANPLPPYSGWDTAARTIQEAVDVTMGPGALVLVSNGVYSTGGRAVFGAMTNRVVVDRPAVVRSVNGPEVTVIQGYQVPDTLTGDGAVRCAYMTNGAVLSGFTLANGATRSTLTGTDETKERSGGGVWCESTNAVISNCVITANVARSYGGGAYRGTLKNCFLTANTASVGGGVAFGALNNCAVSGHRADSGGGTYSCDVVNCTLIGNAAGAGGGAQASTLFNCILYYNANGGNYEGGTLNYCCTTPLPDTGTGNITTDPQLASASHLSATSPCRGAGSADYSSGVDVDGETWLNPPSIGCDEYRAGEVSGSLAVAIRASMTYVGLGIPVDLAAIISGPVVASVWDFGEGTVVSNQPYTSLAWSKPGDYPVILRAYNENYPDGLNATVTIRVAVQPVHFVAAASTNPIAPFSSWETAAQIFQDAVDVAAPGALVLVTNGLYSSGGRAVYGTMFNRLVVDKAITVQSVNGPEVTVIQGAQLPGTFYGDAARRCVYLASGAILSGFTLTNGATRGLAGDPQQERSGGGIWCMSTNALVTNCVITANAASVGGGGAYSGTLVGCSLTGNSTTSAGAYGNGGGAYQTVLINCTLTGNSASTSGGGAYSGILNNCVIRGNSAGSGGGVAGSIVNNSVLVSNSAVASGGGAFLATLNNCTLTGNSSPFGGADNQGTLKNCILYYNSGAGGLNYVSSTMNYCCTTPLPSTGTGNITNEPLFADYLNGNFRLQPNSPCINAGNNAYVFGTTDLDGLPRIAGGTVDIGAYEFQTPTSQLSYAWLQQFGLPTDGSADFNDPDRDGLNNWQEWVSGTDPANPLSALRLLPPTNSLSGVTVTWQSVTNHAYFLERSTNLGGRPLFRPLATNLPGQSGTTTFKDSNAPGSGPVFYRAGIQP